MTWLRLLLLALATFTVWEWLAVILPTTLPAWLQPLVVAGMAYGAQWLPERWLFALAVAGLVAVLHVVVRNAAEGQSARLPQRVPARRRVPDLP